MKDNQAVLDRKPFKSTNDFTNIVCQTSYRKNIVQNIAISIVEAIEYQISFIFLDFFICF
jgi:hypothetical protein